MPSSEPELLIPKRPSVSRVLTLGLVRPVGPVAGRACQERNLRTTPLVGGEITAIARADGGDGARSCPGP